MSSTLSSGRSLNDIDSLGENFGDNGSGACSYHDDDDDVVPCGDGRQTHIQEERGVHLGNGDVMDVNDLARCLQALDNASLATGPSWKPVAESPRLLRPPHCRREAVVCVVSLRTASTFCFAVISRLGGVGVYDAALTLLDSYKLELGFVHPHAKIGTGREGDLREPRQRNTWVNDAVFLPDAQMLVVAASDRSLSILDASRLLHCRRCQVRSLPAPPRCLAYAPGGDADAPRDAARDAARLFIGDEAGGVTTLTFLQPRRALLRPPDVENRSTAFFWSELRHQAEWVVVHEDPRVHGDAVCRLWYEPHNDSLVSCSRDPRRTLVIRHLAGLRHRREPYTFSLPRGASCFVLDRAQQLLVTAGRDAVVRLWNPLVPSQAQATLLGHRHPVLDVAVVNGMVVSMDLQGTLKVWHAWEHTCLQSVSLPFSCLRVPGRRIEHGGRSLYLAPSDEDGASQLVAALCGELVTIKVLPPPARPAGTGSHQAGGGRNKAQPPPRRDQSPAIPESWSPSLLSPTSTSTSTPRGPREGTSARRTAERHERVANDAADDAAGDSSVVSDFIPKSTSPLPESIADWPVPEDRLFKEEEPRLHGRAVAPPSSSQAQGARASPPEPVSHRPVPDADGLYPEELASLRALGLRPLDLDAIGVSLVSAKAPGGGGALSLVPMDALASVRQAHATQRKSGKQMRTLAWHCAPHLALKLPEETPLQFSRPLPVSSRMRAKGVDVSDPQRLMHAKLNRLGPTRLKSSLGIDPSASASSGRRSSIGGSIAFEHSLHNSSKIKCDITQ